MPELESDLAGVRKALLMEERRLKMILSHISPGLASNSATCNILNRKNKRGAREDSIGDKWNFPRTVLDDPRLPPHCAQTLTLLEGCRNVAYAGHMPVPGSSSNLCEDKRSGPKEKSIRVEENVGSNGTDVRFKITAERIQQNNFMACSCSTSTGPIAENAQPRTSQPVNPFPSFVDSNSISNELTLQSCRGVLRTSLRANDFGYQFQGGREGGSCTSGAKELYRSMRLEANGHRKDRKPNCLVDLKPETDQLDRSNRNEPAVEGRTLAPQIFAEAQAILNREYELNSVVDVTHLEERVREEATAGTTGQRAADKKDTEGLHEEKSEMNRESSSEAQVNQHRATVNNQQGDAVTRGIFKTPANQDQQTASFRSSRFNREAFDYRSEAGARVNLSRNNAMTGQRNMGEDCIFCHIVEGRSPAFKLYEDEMCICILDVHPLSHGHSLIIPKAHFRSLELTPPEVAAAMCAAVPVISRAIMEATTCDSFNLLVNSGTAAGQVVFHTHFHVIPRRLGDNLWRSKGSCRGPLPLGHETSLLVQQIRHKLSGL